MPPPGLVENEAQLEDLLTAPTPVLTQAVRRLDGDLLILGIHGKMGADLGRLACRAAEASGSRLRVLGVSRFTDPAGRKALERDGIRTIACDLLDRRAVARLPRAANVIFMVGRKFGTAGGGEALTWATNTLAPGMVAEHFRESRIVVFSTGCVYPLVRGRRRGSRESDAPDPIGEYAQSCLGRERIFEHASGTRGTPVCLFRLNYAHDLRYGVLHDIAAAVRDGRAVSLDMPRFNALWQGDANRLALLALSLCASPPAILNAAGPEILSTRRTALEFGRILGRRVRFCGHGANANAGEAGSYLSDASEAWRRFGAPEVDARTLIRWQAHWLALGGRSLGKPTHFEVSSGRF